MKCLLDTHAYLWWLGDPGKVGSDARHLIMDAKNTIYVSVASFWEMGIKSSLGKLALSNTLTSLADSLADAGLTLLPVSPAHCAAVRNLPFHHRDPFDRMLISQAIQENMVMLSRDANFPLYPVALRW